MSTTESFPELIDFVAGYQGPVEAQFQGGSIKVVSVLLYSDGLRIEWRMNQEPDLSWLDTDETTAIERLSQSKQPSGQLIERMGVKRLRRLWEASVISDGRGGEFKLSLRKGLLGGPWHGEAWCAWPSPPPHPQELTLHIGNADIAIPCRTIPFAGTKSQTSEFLAGYPGPKRALEFHGGVIRIISVLIYTDIVTIEWLMRPVPDMSRLPATTNLFDETLSKLKERGESDSSATGSQPYDTPYALWLKARLADDRGTNYLSELGPSGTFPGGYKGELRVTPSVPFEARELHLMLQDMTVFIPLHGRGVV